MPLWLILLLSLQNVTRKPLLRLVSSLILFLNYPPLISSQCSLYSLETNSVLFRRLFDNEIRRTAFGIILIIQKSPEQSNDSHYIVLFTCLLILSLERLGLCSDVWFWRGFNGVSCSSRVPHAMMSSQAMSLLPCYYPVSF